jgi:hypothetical protein
MIVVFSPFMVSFAFLVALMALMALLSRSQRRVRLVAGLMRMFVSFCGFDGLPDGVFSLTDLFVIIFHSVFSIVFVRVVITILSGTQGRLQIGIELAKMVWSLQGIDIRPGFTICNNQLRPQSWDAAIRTEVVPARPGREPPGELNCKKRNAYSRCELGICSYYDRSLEIPMIFNTLGGRRLLHGRAE